MARPLIRGRGEERGSRSLEASTCDPGAPVIGIMGTGDFSRSLARRLVASGYQVVVGSRNPKCFIALFPEEVEVKLNDTDITSHTHRVMSVVISRCGDNYLLTSVITVAVILNRCHTDLNSKCQSERFKLFNTHFSRKDSKDVLIKSPDINLKRQFTINIKVCIVQLSGNNYTN